MGSSKKTVIAVVIVGIVIILAMVAITFFTFRRIRKGSSDKDSSFLSTGDSRNALLSSTRNSTGWEKKNKKSKAAPQTSYGDTQLRTITQDVLDDEQTLEAMLGGEVFEPVPKGKDLAAKTKAPRSNEVVTMDEVVPGSIRKLELLTGAKVVPSSTNGSSKSTLRRPPSVRTYDSRYSKRRLSHPTRLSTVNSLAGETDAPEQLSPTFTYTSNYTSNLNPLSAPPVYNPSNWTGSAGESTQGSYDFVPSQPILPPHIISQHKGYGERRLSLSNMQSFSEYDERRSPEHESEDFGLAMPEPVYKPKLGGERPDIQGHRRSWSGRSILLDLDFDDANGGNHTSVGRTPSPLSQITTTDYAHSRQTSSHSQAPFIQARSPESMYSDNTKLLSPTTATNLKPELSSTFGIPLAETDRIRQLLTAADSSTSSSSHSSPDLSRPPQAQQSSQQYNPNSAQSIRDSIVSVESSSCSISSGSRITPVTTVLSPTPAPRSNPRQPYPIPPVPDVPQSGNSSSSRIRNLSNAGMHSFSGRGRRNSTAESTISDAKSIMSSMTNMTEKEIEREMGNIRERARRNSLERKIRRRDEEMRGLF
ncbi:hypothetical protein BJ508DRAFT_306893 [Ascobolus immersus RN42]|uniref:Uncharacterized protein n=1 Tax=Ascobolus immersus RN42 TaxID=1160509 RepID=A0A3N4I6T7_ASCIM|nr:hypothetical protein BJ508DRAFT_306893 [Ascobolus immersus RN42]